MSALAVLFAALVLYCGHRVVSGPRTRDRQRSDDAAYETHCRLIRESVDSCQRVAGCACGACEFSRTYWHHDQYEERRR